MDNNGLWSKYFQHHKYPCFVNDKKSGELLYCNEDFLSLYQVTEDWRGQKFSDVVSICSIQAAQEFPDWDIQDVFETETYNNDLNQRFMVRSAVIVDRETIFNEIIPLDETVDKDSQFDSAMTRCIEIYEQRTDSKETLTAFAQLLAEFYNAELAYIYRFHKHDKSIEPLTSWVAPDFKPSEINTGSSRMGKEGLYDWFTSEETPSLIIGDLNTGNNHPSLKDIMYTFAIRNVVFAKVVNTQSEVIGFVGVSNRRDTSKFIDLRFISTISRFVAQDVSKDVVDTALFKLHYQDVLTGLPNREGYTQKIQSYTENPPKKLGVISANINGLKNINNNLGNEAGDEHIKKSALALKKHFGYDIYRVSGDEFIALAEEEEKESFEYKVSTLHEEMRSKDNYDFSFGCGWAEGKYDFSALLLEADTRMYINKQEYYATGVRTFDSVSNAILRDLLVYLDNEEFMIYLQPQVYLKDGSLHGAEALIRRFDKTNQKMVFPDQFIPMYEQASVIRHVDLFVVDTVCKLLAKWSEEEKAVPISVNLSRVTLQEFGIVETIVKICDKHQVDHSLVVIEVTERVGLIENDVPSALVTDFIDHGFTISLDDFGCAYSNIVTLAQIQVDEVKLDKSLVDNLTTNRKNHILVKNVLSMCDELEGMSTLAEGIEDETQSNLLHELGCHLGQGYFYSRPIPVEDFEKEYINKEGETNG